jgi:hypothetical protein
MRVEKLPNGNLIVPCRAEGPGGIIGDGVEEIGPDHPDYESWIAWLRREQLHCVKTPALKPPAGLCKD